MLLLYLHIAAAVIHLISCVLSVVVHIDTKTAITVPKHTYISNPIKTITSHEKIMEQNAMVWISANEGFTLFSHLIAVFYLLRDEEMKKYESLRRTIEYSFTAGILQVALVMSTGSVALHDILFILIINVVMQILGYTLDTSRFLLLVSGFMLLVAEIQYVMLNAINLEGIDTGYFIVMGVLYALFYIGFGMVKVLKPVHESEIYILMSVSSKVTLSWILIGNIFEGFKELNHITEPDFSDIDWRAIQIIVVVVSLVGLAIGIPLIEGNVPKVMSKRMITKKYKNLRY